MASTVRGSIGLALMIGVVAGAMLASAAKAERRVALVIGNSGYQFVNPLPNPANDANAIADLFRHAGFDVVVAKNDLSVTDMRRAMRDFSDQATDADIAVIYYAGHGMEVDGTNYLIPIDAKLERDIDIEDEALSIDRVLRVVEPARRLRLVILDACRDNPFTRSMARTVRNRSIGRGLAKVEPTVSDTLIAFAAKAGSFANDGDGGHSPFTTALINHLTTPGLDLRIAFGMVRDDVLAMTGNKQEPFVYGSLGGALASLAPVAPAVALATPAAPAATKPAAVQTAAAAPTGVTRTAPGAATATKPPPVQTATANVAAAAPAASAGVAAASGLDDYFGRSVQIDFWEIAEETSPQQQTLSTRRSWSIYFHTREDIKFRTTMIRPDPTKNVVQSRTSILGVPNNGVTWEFKDGQIVGVLRRNGVVLKPAIKITGSTCTATIAFEKRPDLNQLEGQRNGPDDMMILGSITAEKVSCQTFAGDGTAAPPLAAR